MGRLRTLGAGAAVLAAAGTLTPWPGFGNADASSPESCIQPAKGPDDEPLVVAGNNVTITFDNGTAATTLTPAQVAAWLAPPYQVLAIVRTPASGTKATRTEVQPTFNPNNGMFSFPHTVTVNAQPGDRVTLILNEGATSFTVADPDQSTGGEFVVDLAGPPDRGAGVQFYPANLNGRQLLPATRTATGITLATTPREQPPQPVYLLGLLAPWAARYTHGGIDATTVTLTMGGVTYRWGPDGTVHRTTSAGTLLSARKLPNLTLAELTIAGVPVGARLPCSGRTPRSPGIAIPTVGVRSTPR